MQVCDLENCLSPWRFYQTRGKRQEQRMDVTTLQRIYILEQLRLIKHILAENMCSAIRATPCCSISVDGADILGPWGVLKGSWTQPSGFTGSSCGDFSRFTHLTMPTFAVCHQRPQHFVRRQKKKSKIYFMVKTPQEADAAFPRQT